jgi:transposase
MAPLRRDSSSKTGALNHADFEWTAVEPMLPDNSRGIRRVNDGRVLNGTYWIHRSEPMP